MSVARDKFDIFAIALFPKGHSDCNVATTGSNLARMTLELPCARFCLDFSQKIGEFSIPLEMVQSPERHPQRIEERIPFSVSD